MGFPTKNAQNLGGEMGETHHFRSFHPFVVLFLLVAGSVSSPMSFADLWDLRQVVNELSQPLKVVGWIYGHDTIIPAIGTKYNVVQSLLEWLWLFIVNYCTDEIHHFGKTIVWLFDCLIDPVCGATAFMSSAFGGSSSAITKGGVGDDGGSTTRTQPGKEKFKFQYSILMYI